MNVRAKFKLISITTLAGTPAKTLVFSPQYDESIPEDVRFAKYTPNGRLEMQVDNPAALAAFEIGHVYYLDFSPVAAPAAPQA
ncbi:hypothetical protein [Dongia sp.]|uniref:hypothetical protein n=1 Tax=Dongia sp. TaxID=1977262 RepID=UPI0035B21640